MWKILTIAAFAAFVYAQTVGPGVPDSRCTGSSETLHFPDPHNCTIFHTCIGPNLFPQQCPDGLFCLSRHVISFSKNSLHLIFEGKHWSTANNWCDWPDRANCQEGKKECPVDNPSSGPPLLLPHEYDCSKFYMVLKEKVDFYSQCWQFIFFKCDWGKRIPLDCPPGQHFDWRNQRCDWPE